MRKLLVVMIGMLFSPVAAQQHSSDFREDQLYFGVAYPYFSTPPETLIQNKLSYALSMGFVRDMPINKSRTWALGLGVGWDVTKWYTNTRFSASGNTISASTLTDDYQQNFLSMQSLALPFEVRWRNATATKHAFWRIHTGVSLHVPMHLKSVFTSASGFQNRDSLPINGTFLRWNLHLGFNTWNISIAQDLQPWAVSNTLNSQFDMKSARIGLVFYIL